MTQQSAAGLEEVTALTFSLTDRETGRRVGAGLLCVDARYCSVLWHGKERIERAFVSPAVWKNITHEVSLGLALKPLDKTSAIGRVFTRDRAVNVQWGSGLPVMVDQPEKTAAVLDQLLRSIHEKP